MQKLFIMAGVAGAVLGLSGCDVAPKRGTYNEIKAQMADAIGKSGPVAPDDAVANALLPPVSQLAVQMPKARQALEERFNVAFNNVPVNQFYQSLVAGTRYNMLVHPDVTGTVSANLKDVTLVEALDAIRELYGYDYKIEGARIYIRPLTMQTRMFQVNYLTASRRGASNLRVSSNASSLTGNNNSGQNVNNGNGIGTDDNGSNQSGSNGNNGNNGGNNNGNNGGNGGAQAQRDASSVSTRSNNDFWGELKQALEAIVGGAKDGRSVVISPQSGVLLIRAMPDELRSVEQYLRATQLSVDRQVILEAKILEVQLNSSSQSGINWTAFGAIGRGGGNKLSGGLLSPGTTLPLPSLIPPPGPVLANAVTNGGSLFGLAFQTSNFAALITFLESQGTVHVLSSPRIATLNNQKAVLKIGTDEFFVTGVSTTITNSAAGTGTVTPSVNLQPFFSGVVLDVTPQIDGRGNVILHVHPSVSEVSTVTKAIDLGSAGSLTLPLASSNTSEMDSVVRGQDGRVVALGGLMRQSSTANRYQVPGAGDLPLLGALFRNTDETIQKRELVVLIKPTVVDVANDWNQNLLDASRRIDKLAPPQVPQPQSQYHSQPAAQF